MTDRPSRSRSQSLADATASDQRNRYQRPRPAWAWPCLARQRAAGRRLAGNERYVHINGQIITSIRAEELLAVRKWFLLLFLREKNGVRSTLRSPDAACREPRLALRLDGVHRSCGWVPHPTSSDFQHPKNGSRSPLCF